MNELNPETRVIVIGEDQEVRRGVVKAVYKELDVAIVDINGGGVEKIPLNCIGVDPFEIKDQKPNKPEKKAEITITSDEFMEITTTTVAKITSETSSQFGNLIADIGAVILANIHKDLFDKDND